MFLSKWEKVLKIKCPKQNIKIVFILFKIILELKNIKQDDVKDALREKHFKTGLHDLELVEESATAKGGKLNLNVPREL